MFNMIRLIKKSTAVFSTFKRETLYCVLPHSKVHSTSTVSKRTSTWMDEYTLSSCLPTMHCAQWRKISGVTGEGGRVPPDIFHREIFDDLPGKEGQGRKLKCRGKK